MRAQAGVGARINWVLRWEENDIKKNQKKLPKKRKTKKRKRKEKEKEGR